MNFHRKVYQETGEELVNFFSFEENVKIEELNNIVANYKPVE